LFKFLYHFYKTKAALNRQPLPKKNNNQPLAEEEHYGKYFLGFAQIISALKKGQRK
jgi:hypothetical protein